MMKKIEKMKRSMILTLANALFQGKTTILDAGISRRVIRKPPCALGKVRVPPRTTGRVRVVDDQVGQARLG
jgi:hypothetical protein